MKLMELLESTAERLEGKSDTVFLDAQVLLAHVLGKPRSWILAHSETSLTPTQEEKLESCVQRLEQGEPLPYILERWEFFGLEFEVTHDVLIPRPETELLVEAALRWLRDHPKMRLAADIGTGSGCIAITLAVNVPDLQLIATDISAAALEVARRNAEKFRVSERMEFFCCDLLPPISQKIDLLVGNLPYIPSRILRGLPIYGREPTAALDGGEDGMDLIRRLLLKVPEILAPGGKVFLEIEASEGPAAVSLAYDLFENAEIHLHQDLAGHDRLLEVQL